MAFKMKRKSPLKFPFGAFIRLGFMGTKKSILDPGTNDSIIKAREISNKPQKDWTDEDKKILYKHNLIT